MPPTHFRRMLHQYFCREWLIPPSSAAISYLLMQDSDNEAQTIACWWIAAKFDTGNMIPCNCLVRDLPIIGSTMTLLLAERDVLVRCDFHIPWDTIVRRVYDHLPEAIGTKHDEWLHALLRHGLIHILSPFDWACVLQNLLEGTSISSILQSVSYSFGRRARKRMLPNSPRITQKRKRGEDGVEIVSLGV